MVTTGWWPCPCYCFNLLVIALLPLLSRLGCLRVLLLLPLMRIQGDMCIETSAVLVGQMVSTCNSFALAQKHKISIPPHLCSKTDTEGRGTTILSAASVSWEPSPPISFLLCIMVLIGWSDGKKTLVAETEQTSRIDGFHHARSGKN